MYYIDYIHIYVLHMDYVDVKIHNTHFILMPLKYNCNTQWKLCKKTLQFVINLKDVIKFYLASHFGLYFKNELSYLKKIFHSFIDLGLHLICVKMKVIALL